MRLIQFLLSSILLIWLLIVAWPLFLVLAIILIYAWWRFVKSIRIMKQEVFKDEQVIPPTISANDVFDAEYKEKDIPND